MNKSLLLLSIFALHNTSHGAATDDATTTTKSIIRSPESIAFCAALHAGDFEKSASIIEANPIFATKPDRSGRTLLLIGSYQKRVDIVEFLLAHGAKEIINKADNEGTGPLAYAAHADDPALTKLLLEHGAQVDVQDLRGVSPLMLAISGRKIANIACLLDHKANVNLEDTDGHTALTIAIAHQLTPVAKTLLEYGANPNATTQYGATPLSFAINYENEEIIEMLAAKGANLNEIPHVKIPYLSQAVITKNFAVVKTLVKLGVSIDLHKRESDGYTLFEILVCNYEPNIYNFLTSAELK